MAGSNTEGIALYHLTDTKGYAIVPVQVDNTFKIYQREENNSYLGTLKIGSNGVIDKTEKTDDTFASSTAFTFAFPNGVFVAHDGISPSGYAIYTLVSWKAIADSFGLRVNPLLCSLKAYESRSGDVKEGFISL